MKALRLKSLVLSVLVTGCSVGGGAEDKVADPRAETAGDGAGAADTSANAAAETGAAANNNPARQPANPVEQTPANPPEPAGHPLQVLGVLGPAGGTLRASGLTITVPAGALSTTETIGFTEETIAPPDHVVSGKVYRFSPAGMKLALPATATLPGNEGAGTIFWESVGANPSFLAQTTTFGAEGASASLERLSAVFVGSSAKPITCIVQRTSYADCATTTTTERPTFSWGGDSFDPKTSISVLGSPGLAAYVLQDPRLVPDASGRTRYRLTGWNGVDIIAHVSGNRITSLDGTVARQGEVLAVKCPAKSLISVSCSGGNYTLPNR